MRANGLKGAHARKGWKKHRHGTEVTEDLLERDFQATAAVAP